MPGARDYPRTCAAPCAPCACWRAHASPKRPTPQHIDTPTHARTHLGGYVYPQQPGGELDRGHGDGARRELHERQRVHRVAEEAPREAAEPLAFLGRVVQARGGHDGAHVRERGHDVLVRVRGVQVVANVGQHGALDAQDGLLLLLVSAWVCARARARAGACGCARPRVRARTRACVCDVTCERARARVAFARCACARAMRARARCRTWRGRTTATPCRTARPATAPRGGGCACTP